MHDIMFAGRIIHLLKEKLGDKKDTGVVVNVVLGPFTHVTKESLRSAFKMLCIQEGFPKASLNIEKRKAAIKCNKCQAETEIESAVVLCPSCGSSDFELVNTEELIISSIEIDAD